MRAHDEDNTGVNTFNTTKEDLKQLKDQTNHRLAKLEGTCPINSAEVETLHVIADKNELIKSLRETTENLKIQLMDRSTLSQQNIEGGIITTPRL